MSSTTKTLELLSHFSVARPEIGLTQFCRLALRDKATTYRHLQSLETAGFIEQNPMTKAYRLGPALLQLAETREATVPRKSAALPPLHALADATGETSHVAVISGTTVYGLVSCESPQHGIRAIMDLDTFPLHATASGLCALAFGPAQLLDVACENLHGFTAATPPDRATLVDLIASIRQSGFGQADRTYEDEVKGVSAPIFDQTGNLAGTVAVACVASRFTPELERAIKRNLITASRAISRNWGGTIPASIEAAWANSTTLHMNELDTAS